jgi:hypothetical protein
MSLNWGFMALKIAVRFGIGVAIATSVFAQSNSEFGDFIGQIGGSTDFKTLQGSRLSVIGRVTGAVSTTPTPNGSITPDHARDDAGSNFGYDFLSPKMSGYRFFNVDNKADQLATAKAAKGKFTEECVSKNGVVEPDESPVASRFWQEHGSRFANADNYFKSTVATAVCVGADQKPIGGFVAITRTLKTEVLFVRKNRTAIYAIKGSSIASAQTFAAEELERVRLKALEETRAQQLKLAYDLEQRRLEAWRKTIALGTSTNCGLVIDVRGPLVQVQLPSNIVGPSGQREFWIKRTELTDHSPVHQCTFGS